MEHYSTGRNQHFSRLHAPAMHCSGLLKRWSYPLLSGFLLTLTTLGKSFSQSLHHSLTLYKGIYNNYSPGLFSSSYVQTKLAGVSFFLSIYSVCVCVCCVCVCMCVCVVHLYLYSYLYLLGLQSSSPGHTTQVCGLSVVTFVIIIFSC